MRENILIIGGRTQARSLAESLLKRKHVVTIISDEYDFCLTLSSIQGLNVINGNGSKPYVLEDANVGDFDVAIAMTTHDADNLVICELCKYYGVKKVVAVVNDPKKLDFFYKMGVDSAVCTTTAISNIIEQQAVVDEIGTIIPTTDERIRINEVTVPKFSPIIGKDLSEIKLPREVIVGCILRGSESIVPHGSTIIKENDTLLLISSESSNESEAIKRILGK